MFDLPPLAARALEIVVLAVLSAIALGGGVRVLRLMGAAAWLSTGEQGLFGLALGYGVLSFAMLLLGTLGIVSLPMGLGVLLLLGALGFRPLREWLAQASRAVRRAREGVHYPPNIFLAGVIALTAVTTLVKALVPVGTHDDLMYHLALPRRYIEEHAVRFQPDSTYSLFPQAMEMLYTWGLLIGSDRLAVLFALALGMVAPAAAALFCKRYLGGAGSGVWRSLPLLCAALLLTTPLIIFIPRGANTDLAQASLDFLAVYAFCLAVSPGLRDNGQSAQGLSMPLLALAGTCCGLSFSIKYYGVGISFFCGFALLVVVLARWRRREGLGTRSSVLPLAAFGIPLAALAAPWLLRNLVSAGNPVWPLAGTIFGGAYWSPETMPEALLGRVLGPGVGSIAESLEFIWLSVWRPPTGVDNHVQVVSLGPLLLPCLLALPAVRWRRAALWLALALVVYWFVWAFFFSHTSIRYFATFLVLAAPLSAYALVSLAARARANRWILGSVLAPVLALLAMEPALSAGQFLPTVLALDRGAEREYLRAHMEDQVMMEFIEEQTPPNAVVYVWDSQPRGYRIPRRYVYGRLVPLFSGVGGDIEAWRSRLVELGATHVLYRERNPLAPGQPRDVDPLRDEMQQFRARYFGPMLFEIEPYSLYELRP
jgi:hypothetical protein